MSLKFFETGRSNLFVLGCLEQRVTIFSQQVRALNLIHELKLNKTIGSGSRVVVIGAGAGGLTAAAAAAHCGCQVTVLEKALEPLPLQANSTDRFVHPHIWDWPLVEAITEDANLPLINWTAASAREVAKELWEQFEALQKLHGSKLECRLGVTNVRVSGEKKVSVSFTHERAYPAFEPTAVILAVGFGLEPAFADLGSSKIKTYSYWHPHDPAWSAINKPRRFLVSGSGDSGLIEVLRIRFRHFDMKRLQTEWLQGELLDSAAMKEVAGYLAEVEKEALEMSARGDDYPRILEKAYLTVTEKFPVLVDKVRSQLRPDTSVVLNSRQEPWPSLQSSPLNRLLVGILLYAPKGEVKVNYDLVTDVRADPRGEHYEVTFGGNSSEPFDDIVVRHGPEKRSGAGASHDDRPVMLRPFLSMAEVDRLRSDARHDATRAPNFGETFGEPAFGPRRRQQLGDWSDKFAALTKRFTHWSVCGDAIVLPVALAADGTLSAQVTVPYDMARDELRKEDVFDGRRLTRLLDDSADSSWVRRYDGASAEWLVASLQRYASSAPTGRVEKCKVGFAGYDFAADGSASLKVRPVNHLVTEHFNRALAIARFTGDRRAERLWEDCLTEFLKAPQNHSMPCPSQLFIELSLTTSDGRVPIVRKNATNSVYARRYGRRVRTCGPESGPAWTKLVVPSAVDPSSADLAVHAFVPTMLSDEYGLKDTKFELKMHSLVVQGMHLNSALLGHCSVAMSSEDLAVHLRALRDRSGLNFDALEFWDEAECRRALESAESEAWHGTALCRLEYLVQHWETSARAAGVR